MVTFYLATLFPKIFDGVLSQSMLHKARKLGLVDIKVIDIRDFGLGKRHQVDDTPYGGGDGMLLMIEPLFNLIKSVKEKSSNQISVLLPSPRGKSYLQSDALRLSKSTNDYLIICPRYEGYDDRLIRYVDETFSIGNYVLTGGEIPAMIMVDSITRLIPGVLGGETSAEIESFADDKTREFPQYTRPEKFDGQSVPKVLLTGNHKQIEVWRHSMMLKD